jgi:hypothetical protein
MGLAGLGPRVPIGSIDQQHKVFRLGLADRLAAQAG